MHTDEIKIILTYRDETNVDCEVKLTSTNPATAKRLKSEKGYYANSALAAITAAVALICHSVGKDAAEVIDAMKKGVDLGVSHLKTNNM